MIPIIRIAVLANVLLAALPGADSTGATPAAPTTPATPAAPAAPAAKIAFGVVSIAADHHSLTMVDAKGMPLKLTITDATTVTIDLKKAALGDVSPSATVRVTYTGDVADAIDQLKPDKKKKKKTV
jgi:hypothetical protein